MKDEVRFRIYPDSRQALAITRTFGCCRLIYNKGLALCMEQDRKGKEISYPRLFKMLADLKQDEKFSFLNEADSDALDQTLKCLIKDYGRYKEGTAPCPSFKKKRSPCQSYQTGNEQGPICITGEGICLPNLGVMKSLPPAEVSGICFATIGYMKDEGYYAALAAEDMEDGQKMQ